MKTKELFPYYCLLFAAYPALSLMGHNITENQVYVVIRPLLLSVLLELIILLISRLLFRGWTRAGLFTLFASILFFSFGHVLDVLNGVHLLGVDFGRFKVLAIVALLLLLAGGWAISRIRLVPAVLNGYLTIVALVLLAMPVYQIVSYTIQKAEIRQTTPASVPAKKAVQPAASDLPDIYYIILDTYTRQDAFSEHYQFDNQPFLDQLRSRGFYIAGCSRSNYQYTLLSLSSTFNMNYLDQLDSRFQPNAYRVDFMEELIDHSQVRADLESAGYKFIDFQSSYDGTTIEDADELVTNRKNPVFQTALGYLNPFEEMYLNTTTATLLFRLPPGRLNDLVARLSFSHADEALTQEFQLDTLPVVAKQAGPKFVFVHMNIPHAPFIFTADGSWQVDPDYYTRLGANKNILGYVNQVEFLNSRLPDIVDDILAASKTEPIIILQGDHGMDTGHRSEILNAYHVPAAIEARLYPTITPVNTYRILLSELLGKDYPLLPDRTFASDTDARFNISENFEQDPVCVAAAASAPQP